MQRARSRFSHRHLLALTTFLIPLAILAALGWSELRRSGDRAQAALEREGRQFLETARQAMEQRLDRYLPEVLDESERQLLDYGPVRASLRMAANERFAPLRGILLLDEQLGVAEPNQLLYAINLPLVRDFDLERDNPLRGQLQAVDLLLEMENYGAAVRLLEPMLASLARANPPGDARSRRRDLEEVEIVARFRLATARLVTGEVDEARTQLEKVKQLQPLRQRRGLHPYALLADLKLAELATPTQRLMLLRAIAEGRHTFQTDDLLTAVATRLAASFPADHGDRAEVDELLREEHQRAAIRSFAGDFDIAMKPFLKYRRSRHADADGDVQRHVATVDGKLVLVCVRPALDAERQKWQLCASVALQLDLAAILGPTWQQFGQRDGTFVLAVREEDNTVIAAPTAVPADYTPPTVEAGGLTLAAHLADPAGWAAAESAAASKRTLLILFLFVTALGGALWSWRSVSREAELASLKIDLVSRVSHELKTPLALVRMYGETLSMGRARDSNQAAEFGGIIAREAERLTTLIQRILDFSRQQAGTLAYQKAPIDLGALLRGVAEAYSPHLEARGVILIDSLPSDIAVQCDANACESAVVNLLENAAKYGRDGDIEHEVDLVLERRGNVAVVEVRDRGRGIPPNELGRVFDGFYRASNAGEVRGAGLGLSLVKHFARAHDGDIQALPRDGGGTVMRLTLPVANVPTPPSVDSPPAPSPARPDPAPMP